jgi:DNA-binding IclR family transcriptional regulator
MLRGLDMGDAKPGEGKERRGIQSVEVGGQLLLTLSALGHPLSLEKLARAANMAPGKAHPYLSSLSRLGLVTQEPSTGQYWLGPTAMQLGLVTLRTVNPVREATSFAEQLARDTGHSVALSVWGNQGPTVVFLLDAAYPLHTNIRPGTVMSLAGTATGRLFAAYLPTQLSSEALLEDGRRLGPDIAEPVTQAELHGLLKQVREHGVSRSINHPTAGICAFAAPVFDYSANMVLAVALIGRTRSFDTDWDGDQAKAAKACGMAISRRLGDHSQGLQGASRWKNHATMAR